MNCYYNWYVTGFSKLCHSVLHFDVFKQIPDMIHSLRFRSLYIVYKQMSNRTRGV